MQYLAVVCSGLLLAANPSFAGAQENKISFSDPEGIIYTITDRGPNIKTKDAKKLMGTDFGKKKI